MRVVGRVCGVCGWYYHKVALVSTLPPPMKGGKKARVFFKCAHTCNHQCLCKLVQQFREIKWYLYVRCVEKFVIMKIGTSKSEPFFCSRWGWGGVGSLLVLLCTHGPMLGPYVFHRISNFNTHVRPHTHTKVKLYNEKRRDLEEQQLHLNVGLQKIRETVDQVEELQASLSIKKAELQQKNDLANQKLKQMVSLHVSEEHMHYQHHQLHIGERPTRSRKEESNFSRNSGVTASTFRHLAPC